MSPASPPIRMSPQDLEQYLHVHIPLARAMQASVCCVQENAVELAAPLAPNINHRDSVFGGSASALCILAAWALLQTRLQAEGIDSRLVIQRNTMEYERAILGAFSARATLDDPGALRKFGRVLTRRGRARISVPSVLLSEGQVAGRFRGDFVALDTGRETRRIE